MTRASRVAYGHLPRLAVVAVVCCVGCARQARPPSDHSPRMVAEAYVAAHNSHDVDAVMAIYDDEATFELVGDFVIEGKAAIRELEEFDAALSSELVFSDYVETANKVTHKVVERNDFLRAMGIEFYYDRSTITVRDGLIWRIKTELARPSAAEIEKAFAPFDAWVKEKHPEARARLMPGGRERHTRESALEWLRLVRQWEEARGLDRHQTSKTPMGQ